MKKLIQLTLFAILFALLPGRAVSAQDPQPPLRIFMPIVSRQISLTISHVSPNIGRTLGVVQDPFNPNIVYTYTFGSGIYKSVDYGYTWFPSSNGMTYMVIQSLEADPVTPGVLYAGTYGEPGTPFNGVYKSSDYGVTWAQTGVMGNTWNGTYYKNPVVYAVVVDRTNPNIVFAATRMKLPNGWLGGGGVFRSNDAGATWTPVNNGLPNHQLYVYDLILNPDKPGLVYATLHGIPPGGIYISYDYGNNWTQYFSQALDGRALLLDPFNTDTLFYGAATMGGIWRRYKDGGWNQIAENMNVNIRALSADPFHPGVFYAGVQLTNGGTNRLLRTTDGGQNWLEIDAGYTAYPLAFSPNQQSVYMAIDFEGVVRSDNYGLNWQASTYGLTGYSVTGLAVAPTNPNYLVVAMYGEGVRVSPDLGATWIRRSQGLDTRNLTYLVMRPNKPSVMYVATDQSGVYRSSDDGLTWVELTRGYPTALAGATSDADEADLPFANRPIPEPDEDVQPMEMQQDVSPQALYGLAGGNTMVVSPVNGHIVLVGTTGRGVYSLAYDVWSATGLASGSVYSLMYDLTNGGRLLAGTDASTGGVLVSLNNGETWTPSNAGLAGRKVYSLAQSAYNTNIFLAGTDSGVYTSIDSGATWSLAGLSGQVIRSVAVHRIAGIGPVYFGATDRVAYYSENLPGSWAVLSPELNDLGIQHMVRDPLSESVYFLTRLGGLKHVK